MRSIARIIPLVALMAIFYSCSNNNALSIKGDPEAVEMAQAMMDSLGGRSHWEKLKSLYVRTFIYISGGNQNYISEQWIELDKPRVMYRKTNDAGSELQIVDGNDGWMIRDNVIDLLSSESITALLTWHQHYFIRFLKIIATGGENYEIKKREFSRFDLYDKDKFIGGVELDEKNYPVRYFDKLSTRLQVSSVISKWGEYQGYKYPLEVHPQENLSILKTDYWNPGELDAEQAFKISFNPNTMLERMK